MEKDTVVVVESHSIVTLSDYLMEHKRLTYESVEQMILHLGNQMIVLSEVGIGMLFFNLNFRFFKRLQGVHFQFKFSLLIELFYIFNITSADP